MKKIFALIGASLMMWACNQNEPVTVTVTNPTAFDRSDEIVEVSMAAINQKLKLRDTARVVVFDETGTQVPYQITYDDQLIFPATVAANGTATYTIQQGVPHDFESSVYGRCYPERLDDIAWENDLTAYRTYGPALKETGEQAFGYDIWVKNVPQLVVEERYKNELNPETTAKIAELRKTNPKAADELYKSVSYHVDHGNGLDCYKVGPTLGGGTSALIADGKIIYPYCYRRYEILNNGPLRFTVRLTYDPIGIHDNGNIIETRLISLDKGSHLNRTVVNYRNLAETLDVATGIVIHPENKNAYKADAENGYIAYEDLTDNVKNNNGKIYVGAVFTAPVKEAKAVMFSAAESRRERGGASGHVLATSEYAPATDYIYYWGSAWSKAGMESLDAWTDYLENFSQRVKNPLTVTIE